MKKGKIHIGTSGWSYKDWKGLFYPKKLKSTSWLTYYAQTFSITEINSSFYHLPKKQTVEGWVKKVPDHFLFCPKMSQYLTHFKHLKDPEETLHRFFDVFAPMSGKMGPVLLQLPPSLRFHYDTTAYLFQVLKEQYADYDFALEIRHKSWLEEESLELMRKFNIAFVIAQSGNRFPYAEHITAKHIYVRFHGPEGLYNSSYSNSVLQQFAGYFNQWSKQGHSVWAFFNNDFYGYAIQNGLKLIELLEQEYAAVEK